MTCNTCKISDERTQRAHLPQEKEMEVPQVRPGQDARAEVSLKDRGHEREVRPLLSAKFLGAFAQF
jgi:hypothetical protein